MLAEYLPETSIAGGSQAIRGSDKRVGEHKSRWHQARGVFILI